MTSSIGNSPLDTSRTYVHILQNLVKI